MKTIFKVKNTTENRNRLDVLIEWAELLNTTLREEALATLKEENCTFEQLSIFAKEGDLYLVSESEHKGERKPSNKEKSINRLHARLWRSVEKEPVEIDADKADILYSLKR